MKIKLLSLIFILSFLQTNAQCWQTMTVGSNHTIVLKSDGSLWGWGNNTNGQLGISGNGNTPTRIGTASDWKAAAAGWAHTAVIKTDGTLWAWGYGVLGQIGNGSNATYNVTQQVGSDKDWKTITAGNHNTFAIKNDGTLWAWGYNEFGELGDGTLVDKNTPVQIGSDKDWEVISATHFHTIGLKKDGSLWAWGDNSKGQLGDNTKVKKNVPTRIGTANDWKTIAAGFTHTMAIKNDGTLWAWGFNGNGALGDGTTIDQIIPVQIGTAMNWKTISAGTDNSLAIKTDGTLWSWGYNSSGKLGIGTTEKSFIPVQIGTANNWFQASCGDNHGSAITIDGSIFTWGQNSSGQLGDNTNVSKSSPVSVECKSTLVANTQLTYVTCFGAKDGSAAITSVTGGTAPYTYLWSNGKTSATITGLPPGNYTCTIKDAALLSITKSIIIAQPLLLTAVVEITNVDCSNTTNNGRLTVTATGGTAPYKYALSPGNFYQTSNVLEGLAPGNYEVVVKDSNGCLFQIPATITIESTPPPTAKAQSFNNTAIVGNLKPGGSSFKWFNTLTGGNALDLSTPLKAGKYYVSQTVYSCESTRTAVDVSIVTSLPVDGIPTDGLVAYYPFNGNADDASGNKSNGTVAAATLTSDRFGNSDSAYSFNGKDSFINAVIPNIPQNNSSRTISGWFKTDDVFSDPKKNETCIFNYGALNKLQRLSVYIYSKGYLETITGSDFSSDDFYVNNFNYSNNDWYFFTLTYNGTKLSLYVNGKFVDEKNVNLNTINNTFRIGETIPDIKEQWFKGKIDDVAIWNRVLTQEEISALYTPGEQTVYTLIPDADFERKLLNLGIDSGSLDGKVQTSKINTLTSLNISNSDISDLTGIQDFVSLTNLNCSQNSLKALNLSKNIALTVLDCNNNQIATLDVSNNVALTDLICYSNKLTSLNVKKNTALTKLDSGSNQYTTLDVSSNTALTFLGCNTSQLTSIDVSKNTALKLLDCRENKITNLDVSKLTALTELYCQSNQLKDLDVSKNKSLELINCSKNQLTTLDISAHPAAIGLYANSNQLTSLNLKNGNNANFQLLYLNLTNNPNLSCIQVDDKVYSDANWSTKKDATASYDTNCTNSYTEIPDSNFEERLIMLGIDKDGKNGKVLNASISKVDHLYVGEYAIKDLTGISGFTSLRGLRVSGNELTSLDLSKNTLLDSLDCSKNKLRTLNLKNGNNKNFYSKTSDFSNNPDLTCIQVDDATYSNENWATIKDAAANYNKDCTVIYTLIPDSNFEQKLIDLGIDTDGLNGIITTANISSIISLDLSNANIKDLTGIENFTTLNILDCRNNQLTTLDLSKNSNLQILYVTGNPLVYLNLQNGNNQNLIIQSVTAKNTAAIAGTTFLSLNSLSCIKVDNAAYSNANWSKIKESTTTYSETCTLGIEDNVFDKLSLYPNPTKGELNIQNVSLEKATVYNSLGQLVKTFTLDSSNVNNTINLSGLPKGIYYVYLINQDAASAKKVIVE